MARSYKKVPICGNAGISDKSYKRYINRKKRRVVKRLLRLGIFDGISHNIPYNSWNSNKDGKHCFIELKQTDFDCYQKLMRK